MKRSSESKPNFAGVSEDEIIRRIEDGETLVAIATSVGRARSKLTEWLQADDDRRERSARARVSAAGAWDEKAEQVLAKAKNPLALAKARELAHHYRWRASKINPKQYGERQQVEHSGRLGIEQLVTASRQKPDAG
ncbi:MAG: hypothetical protein OJF61_001944 [Rhodanobacteraceae bacterium]|jgi:hypothetical protein|nr:MAG: hypothetical protein OJF61_001944 [Rhodanobacteraceae bacterium]